MTDRILDLLDLLAPGNQSPIESEHIAEARREVLELAATVKSLGAVIRLGREYLNRHHASRNVPAEWMDAFADAIRALDDVRLCAPGVIQEVTHA